MKTFDKIKKNAEQAKIVRFVNVPHLSIRQCEAAVRAGKPMDFFSTNQFEDDEKEKMSEVTLQTPLTTDNRSTDPVSNICKDTNTDTVSDIYKDTSTEPVSDVYEDTSTDPVSYIYEDSSTDTESDVYEDSSSTDTESDIYQRFSENPTIDEIRDFVALERIRTNGIKAMKFNDVVYHASMQPEPVDLFKKLWFEGELTALYADTNVGKSILAVQIAEHVAKLGKRVCYVDLEMSDKAVEMRSRDENGKQHVFPDNMYRITPDSFRNYSLNQQNDAEEDFLEKIEFAAREINADVVIIDNITAICSGIESGEAAVKYINQLLRMRNNNNWSILFLAHTPKTEGRQAITRDTMAGSKRVISLIDSAFAIGEVPGKQNMRYIKQTKVRQCDALYGENNVMLCKIERVNGLLSFVEKGTASEARLLRSRQTGSSVDEGLMQRLLELRAAGKTYREMAELTGYSKSQIQHYISTYNKEINPEES